MSHDHTDSFLILECMKSFLYYAVVACSFIIFIPYAMVTCKIKLFQNYFGLHRHPSEIILFQRMETCLKFFSKLFQRLIAAREFFPTHSAVTPK